MQIIKQKSSTSQNNSVRLCRRDSREGLFFAGPSVSHQAPYTERTLPGLKMYIISLRFDDGFEQSNQKIADLYERFGLSSCFNVLAHYAERTHYTMLGEERL
jgi:hypothetical protein